MHDLTARLRRIERAIEDQRGFLHRIPDPDTRERAEGHLFTLVEMRNEVMAIIWPQGVARPA